MGQSLYLHTTGKITSIPFSSKLLSKELRQCTICDFQVTSHRKVHVKNSIDSLEKEVSLLKDPGWRQKKLPPVVPPPGLLLERRKYLFEKIHKFCPQECQDSVCPEPVNNSTPPTPKRRRRGD